jgi:hypothetical protein
VKRLFIVEAKHEKKCRFTVPPPVALLNYISSVILWRIFAKLGYFAGFSHYFCRLFMYLCPVVKNKKIYEERNNKRITRRNVQKTIKRIKQKKFKCMVTPEYMYINFDSKWI